MYRLIAIIALPLGVATVLMAASRAPLIALVVLVPLTIFFASYGRGLKLAGWAVVLSAVAVFTIPLLVQQVVSRGVDLYTYFGSVGAFTSSDSSLNRAQLMRDAWHAFEAHPFLGAGLFETYLHTYPHNVVLEALMATGAFGGTMMTCLVVVSIVKSFRLMHNLPEMSWLPILYLQYLIHLMVSGCLYFDPTAFALMGAILAAAPSAPRPIAFPGGPTSLPIRQRGDNAVTNTVCPQTAG
jgi:O-antigen ligase